MKEIMKFKFDQLLEINNIKLTKKYIESMTFEQRENLIEPILQILKENGFPYPDDESLLKKEYERVIKFTHDNSLECYNNSSIGTYITKYFCGELFYKVTEPGKRNMVEFWADESVMRKIIYNRLGLEWFKVTVKNGVEIPAVNEAFNLTPKMFLQGLRSSRTVAQVSNFKADIAKAIYEKYSNDGDVVFDYSIGFGGRLLGAKACNRKYIGVDPLTSKYVQKIVDYFNFKDVKLIDDISENVMLGENTIDFSFSSPPYLTNGKATEEFSRDSNQAYAKGLDYFYNVYWKKTLQNSFLMLKKDKYFALNMFDKETKMVDMTREIFGKEIEVFKLRTIKSHLSGKSKDKNNIEKYEPIYIFKK